MLHSSGCRARWRNVIHSWRRCGVHCWRWRESWCWYLPHLRRYGDKAVVVTTQIVDDANSDERDTRTHLTNKVEKQIVTKSQYRPHFTSNCNCRMGQFVERTLLLFPFSHPPSPPP